jgi:hypothetical protein
MIGRAAFLGLVGGSLLTLAPGNVEAQVAVELSVFWTWGDDGWRSHQPPYAYDRGVYYPRQAGPRYPVRSSPVRVPPGHLPPPGSCRLWYPDRPPGHQPPPRPCGSLLRVRGGGGAVIIGGPDYREGYRYEGYGPGRGREGRGRGH